MQVPIMRNVALVAAGNAAIAGKDIGRFWPDYLAFKFYTSCVFFDEKDALVAHDPNEWLAQIKRDARGLWLHHETREHWIEDRMTTVFVGGGPRWLIEAVRDGGSDIWEGGDKLGGPQRAGPQDLERRLQAYRDEQEGPAPRHAPHRQDDRGS